MRRALILAVAIGVFAFTACGAQYDSTHITYQSSVPDLIGIQRATTLQNAKCAVGAIGSAVGVVAVIAAPEAVLAWIAYGASGPSQTETIQDCWSQFSANTEYWNVYTQCQGEPVLRVAISDYGDIAAYVSYPQCECAISCMNGIPFNADLFNQAIGYYHDGANRVNGPMTDPPPPPTPADMQALAASMGVPYGGCNVPYPQYPTLCPPQ